MDKVGSGVAGVELGEIRPNEILSTSLAQKEDTGSRRAQSRAHGSGRARIGFGLCFKNSTWWDRVSTLLSTADTLAVLVFYCVFLLSPELVITLGNVFALECCSVHVARERICPCKSICTV